jgi:hypothetical protein
VYDRSVMLHQKKRGLFWCRREKNSTLFSAPPIHPFPHTIWSELPSKTHTGLTIMCSPALLPAVLRETRVEKGNKRKKETKKY